jgi:hypothetical protein
MFIFKIISPMNSLNGSFFKYDNFGESLYIRYRSDANVLSSTYIGETPRTKALSQAPRDLSGLKPTFEVSPTYSTIGEILFPKQLLRLWDVERIWLSMLGIISNSV